MDALLAFASAALLWAAFPPLDFGALAWVALVPLLLMAARSSPGRCAAWAGAAGYALFVALLYWLRYVAPEGWLTLALYCALYWPAAALLLRWLKRRGLPFALTAPLVFAALEFARANLFTGFTFFFLAHAQYRYLPVIQIADVTEVYGITFLIALVNGCVADLLLALLHPGAEPNPRRRLLISFGVAAALVALTLGYGFCRMRALRPEPGPKVALIQGNVPQDLKDIQENQSKDLKELNPFETSLRLLRRHVALSQNVGPDVALLVWPETIFPAPMNQVFDQDLMDGLAASTKPKYQEYGRFLAQCRRELLQAIRSSGAYALIGAQTVLSEPIQCYNSAYLISPQGGIVGSYDKIHLVAFGEYTPLAAVFPFLKALRPAVMGPDLTPGDRFQLFDLPSAGGLATKPRPGMVTTFGVTICYEDSEAGLFRRFVQQGAGFMVNITNDGWFRDSAELDEHLAVCAFRAVENRVPIARCANTGISALIAPDGRIAQRAPRDSEQRLIGALSMTSLKAFYTQHGDVFAWLCTAGCVGVVIAGFRRKSASAGEQPRCDEVNRQRQGQRNKRREHPA